MITYASEGYAMPKDTVVREPQPPLSRPTISTPEDVCQLLVHQLIPEGRETFYTVILDARNQVMGVNTVSVGSPASAPVWAQARGTFEPALHTGSPSIILARCRPSSDPTPSQDDIDLARRLRAVGETLGIKVLDYLIITVSRFCSFSDKALL